MNVILIDPSEINGDGRVVLSGRRSEHILKVLRLGCGEKFRIGIINGLIGEGVIETIFSKRGEQGRVVVKISANNPPPPRADIDLILALPRPIMLKRVLAQIASLGVTRVFFINANRVEKSFFASSLLQHENYRKYLLSGLEQAVDTVIPDVSIQRRFRPFVEDFLPRILMEYSSLLLAHPDVPQALGDVLVNPAEGRLLLAIGPEGGWVDFEVDKFKKLGLLPFSLGPRILRVDTAVPALITQINLLRTLRG